MKWICFKRAIIFILLLCFLTPQSSSVISNHNKYLAPISAAPSPTPIDEDFYSGSRFIVAPDGTKIHYAVKGNPRAKETLVFIHGWAAGHSHFQRALKNNPELRRNYRLILITVRGHGKKVCQSKLGKLTGGYYSTIAHDIAHILNEESVDSAVFIGHSMGTQIVRYFNAHRRYAHFVRGLVLVSGFVDFPLNRKLGRLIQFWARQILKSKRRLFVVELAKRHIIKHLLQSKTSQKIAIRTLIGERNIDRATFINYIQTGIAGDVEAFLIALIEMATIQIDDSYHPVPTQLFHGMGDSLIPYREFQKLKALFPHADAHAIIGARHFSHNGREIFPRELNQFLSRVFDVESAL